MYYRMMMLIPHINNVWDSIFVGMYCKTSFQVVMWVYMAASTNASRWDCFSYVAASGFKKTMPEEYFQFSFFP